MPATDCCCTHPHALALTFSGVQYTVSAVAVSPDGTVTPARNTLPFTTPALG